MALVASSPGPHRAMVWAGKYGRSKRCRGSAPAPSSCLVRAMSSSSVAGPSSTIGVVMSASLSTSTKDVIFRGRAIAGDIKEWRGTSLNCSSVSRSLMLRLLQPAVSAPPDTLTIWPDTKGVPVAKNITALAISCTVP